jgi:hypothetical protein
LVDGKPRSTCTGAYSYLRHLYLGGKGLHLLKTLNRLLILPGGKMKL